MTRSRSNLRRVTLAENWMGRTVTYQQLPRAAESSKEPAPELPKTIFEFSEPQSVMGNSRVPKIIDTRELRSKLKNFRFPINIERGSGTPTPPRRALDRWVP